MSQTKIFSCFFASLKLIIIKYYIMAELYNDGASDLTSKLNIVYDSHK